jgi:hypothetical protein
VEKRGREKMGKRRAACRMEEKRGRKKKEKEKEEEKEKEHV